MGTTVSVNQLNSIADLHRLQFSMLGNQLESIYLPSAITLVEGQSDVAFLAKVVQLRIPDRKVAIVPAKGDGEVQNKLNVLREAFGDLSASPYRDRLFVVLDQKHSLKKSRGERQGVQGDNMVVWSENGIEYLYPEELIAIAFEDNTAKSCGA